MLLPKGETTYDYLREPDPQFDANDMLGVTFTNKGESIALINEEEVYPDEHFTTPENVVQTGKFNIQFKPRENALPTDKNRVMVKYTKITGVYNLVEKARSTSCN